MGNWPIFDMPYSSLTQNVLVVRCAIWYYLHNSKNVKNTHGEVLILVKLQASLKLKFLLGCFSHFLNCTNGTKSRNAPLNMRLIYDLCLGCQYYDIYHSIYFFDFYPVYRLYLHNGTVIYQSP